MNYVKKSYYKKNGYTLIELLVVIVIMALVFSVTVANFRDFQTRRSLDNAANQVRADLRVAQERAKAGKKPAANCDALQGHAFVSTGTTSNYYLTAVCSNTSCTNPATDTPTGFCTPRTLDDDITFAASHNIQFNVLGRGTNLTANTTITLTHTNGDTRMIVVQPGGNIE